MLRSREAWREGIFPRLFGMMTDRSCVLPLVFVCTGVLASKWKGYGFVLTIDFDIAVSLFLCSVVQVPWLYAWGMRNGRTVCIYIFTG